MDEHRLAEEARLATIGESASLNGPPFVSFCLSLILFGIFLTAHGFVVFIPLPFPLPFLLLLLNQAYRRPSQVSRYRTYLQATQTSTQDRRLARFLLFGNLRGVAVRPLSCSPYPSSANAPLPASYADIVYWEIVVDRTLGNLRRGNRFEPYQPLVGGCVAAVVQTYLAIRTASVRLSSLSGCPRPR
jgi:hypothetical protein